jgi:hypothetical protein
MNFSGVFKSLICALLVLASGGAFAQSTLTFGTHLTAAGTSYNGSANVTIAPDATSADTASTMVARDGSGNFSAGTITASLTGSASLDCALTGCTLTGPFAAPSLALDGCAIGSLDLCTTNGATIGGPLTFAGMTATTGSNGSEWTFNNTVPMVANSFTWGVQPTEQIAFPSASAANPVAVGVYNVATVTGNGSNATASQDVLSADFEIDYGISGGTAVTGTVLNTGGFQSATVINNAPGATFSDIRGFVYHAVNNSADTINIMYGVDPVLTYNAGTINEYIDYFCGNFSSVPGGGSITTDYCLYNQDTHKMIYSAGSAQFGGTLGVAPTLTATSGTLAAVSVTPSLSPASNSSATYRSLSFDQTINDGTVNFSSTIYGGYFDNRLINGGTFGSLIGVQSYGAFSSATTTITSASAVYGFFSEALDLAGSGNAGTITSAYDYRAANSVVGSITLTNQVGYQVDALNAGTNTVEFLAGTATPPSGSWGWYQSDTNNNALHGSLAVGSTTAPTATLTVTGTETISSTLGLSGALTYGGVTLSNAVTGTGNMVLSASPTFTGTLAAAGLTASGSIANAGIASDSGHTTASVCEDTTSHQFYFGSGTLGVCAGTSSLRYKSDWKPIDVGLPGIMALKPGEYHLKPQFGDPRKPLYGFLAEDVVSVFPKLVGLDRGGLPNTVDYLGLVPVLVKAVQTVETQIDALFHHGDRQDREIAALQDVVKTLERGRASDNERIDRLEHLLAAKAQRVDASKKTAWLPSVAPVLVVRASR